MLNMILSCTFPAPSRFDKLELGPEFAEPPPDRILIGARHATPRWSDIYSKTLNHISLLLYTKRYKHTYCQSPHISHAPCPRAGPSAHLSSNIFKLHSSRILRIQLMRRTTNSCTTFWASRNLGCTTTLNVCA